MEKETRQVGPPGWVVRIVEALIPAEHRDEIAEDLRELCPGTLGYVSFAARTIVGCLRGRMSDIFDVRLIAGEVSLLYVAFAGVPLRPQGARATRRKLLESLENLSDEENDQLWGEEAEQRDAELDAKQDLGIPADEVFRDIRNQMK